MKDFKVLNLSLGIMIFFNVRVAMIFLQNRLYKFFVILPHCVPTKLNGLKVVGTL